MSGVELTEAFLAKIAGWEAMKKARSLLEQGAVLSSNWSPPLLKGVVQEGNLSYRAGLVIKDTINLENICRCRPSQEWGTICAHSVAVGLHHLRGPQETAPPVRARPTPNASSVSAGPRSSLMRKAGKRLLRAKSNEQGETVEIFVILPPNFGTAITRGKVMLCFEGKWSRGRAPLNALPFDVPFRFGARDAPLLDRIEELAEGDTPGMLMLSSADFAGLLPKLVGHPGVTQGKSQVLEVRETPWRVPVHAKLEASGEIRLELRMALDGLALISGQPSWVFRDHAFQLIGLPASCAQLLHSPVRLERPQVPAFLSRDWPALQTTCDVQADFSLDDFVLEPQPPRFILSLAGGLAQLQAQLQCAYGHRIMTMGVTSREETLWLPDPTAPTRYSTRDLAVEQAAVAELLRVGFAGPDPQGRYQLIGQSQVLNFFARLYPRLKEQWEVTLEERLQRSTAQNIEWIEPRLQVTPSGEQWFDLDVSFASRSGERFPASEIQRLVLSGQAHTRLPNGRIALAGVTPNQIAEVLAHRAAIAQIVILGQVLPE